MSNRNSPRTALMASLCLSGAVLLSACQPAPPPPIPGQPLTWAQQHQLDLAEAQEMHDRRKQDHPCAPHDCMR